MNGAFAVEDCIDGVVAKLGNRTDIENDIPKWIRAAVLELGGKFEFEALRNLGPQYAFTVGQNEYNLNNWAQEGEEIDDILSWKMWFSGSTGSGFILKQRGLRVVEQLSMTSGMPVYYNRTNDKKVLVAQTPINSYVSQIRYQKKHPFSANSEDWKHDIIYFPHEWQMAIEYAAAIIGGSERRWPDVVSMCSQLLYGAPGDARNGIKPIPGIISSLVVQQEKDASHNEHQLNVVVNHYTR